MNFLQLDPSEDRKKIHKLCASLEKQALTKPSQQLIHDLREISLAYVTRYHQVKAALDDMAALAILDGNGCFTYVDRKFCEQTKYASEELVGSHYHLLDTECHSESIYHDIWQTIMAGSVWRGAMSYKARDHSVYWVNQTIIPIRDEVSCSYTFLSYTQRISDEAGEPQLIEDVRNDFNRTINALVNLVFKVKYYPKQDAYYYELFEGRLAREIGLTTQHVKSKTLTEIFDETKAAFLREKYRLAFTGQSISYKHTFKGRYFYTTLSPIEENGEYIEIIGSAVDITSREEAELKIHHMAYHDPLTDLPNRRKLEEDVTERITGLIQSASGTLALMYCDLDRFKYVNDALGHAAGDYVIQTMAKRIQEVMGTNCTLYRLSGDEFMIMVEGEIHRHKIEQLGYQVLKRMAKPITIQGKEFFITGSIGVSRYPEGGTTAESMIGNADIAMHYCKMKGRQGLLFYTQKMNRYYNDLVSLEGDLREALSKNELSVYYQPKIDVSTGFINGFEALVRWHHATNGFISPGEFIPLAEETGLITQVDEWVLEEVCRQNKQWHDEGYAPEHVAINVSAMEIQRKDFTSRVHSILTKTGFPPEYLEFEVTENSVMQNTEDCIKTMQELKALGISLSIDDFGTGYSSLGYLRKFPIHYLKIDQSFIKDVLNDPSDAEIVKAMIQLAHTFKLQVIAEGVEVPEVLQFLNEHKCDYYQGYYFSKPQPPHKIKQQYLMPKSSYQTK
ncbi:EAL domain-containing protein [Thalassobacillus sp. CUG 92003]|uniref:sensor domain-containing protein n=1 Tax=Thalassobacillus sp. CUG 92003 TaxID=2736641 RepID=UPI0015E6861C|nr:EAL domain-containing protein [Thalassobacillus sp. CUG 92003]